MNACKVGWFTEKDTEELLTLVNEIGSNFCNLGDNNTEPISFHPTISKIMTRFYPRMEMGQILASREVKRLFVAQTDNIETSSCIITPPQVNFLLNGKGVERRTNVFMDSGPQIPTNVTPMLKYGTNLLQAVGQFNGHYILAIAFMAVISSPDNPVLQDYVQPAVSMLHSDNEIVEGPSRISLNCPISIPRSLSALRRVHSSWRVAMRCLNMHEAHLMLATINNHSCGHVGGSFYRHLQPQGLKLLAIMAKDASGIYRTRIKVPVKGHSCKHLQVLKEVGENVADVIISADGSWKAILESNDHVDQPRVGTLNSQQKGPDLQGSTSFSNASPSVWDLTEGDDEMNAFDACEIEDRKPFQSNIQGHSITTKQTMAPELNNATEVNQNAISRVQDGFCSGILLSTYGSSTHSARSDAQFIGGTSQPSPANFLLPPVLTDAISPALNRGTEDIRGNTHLTTSTLHDQLPIPDSLQLQQAQFGHSIVSNEYGRFPTIPRHITRTPIAVQALPAQTQTSGPHHRSRTTLISMVPNGPNTVGSDMERPQQFSRSIFNPVQISDISASALQHHSMSQNWNQQVAGHPTTSQRPGPGAYRTSSGLPTEPQTLQQQQSPQARTHSNLLRSSAHHHSRSQVQQGGAQGRATHAVGTGISQNAQPMVAAQRAAQMTRMPLPVQNQTSRTGSAFPVNANGGRSTAGEQRGNIEGMVQAVSRPESLVDLASEQNWRPTGLMRGSLVGRAYNSALNQLVIQPTQPTQSTRPPTPITSPPPGFPPHLQALLTNIRTPLVPQAPNYPMTQPASTTGGSGILPERSLGLH
ncbi:E4 SUMO-protein ligase PIAL2 [Vitis vinifera]|uniref:E4 SUMO-protein ligase PIAL2 n=1 Tax=Vitis vinifera TaxID=29760 RepID=A0A438J5F4_VITVI|nr:E4 SUMO-protein ligase PIAL2 [Vitis vinifera]